MAIKLKLRWSVDWSTEQNKISYWWYLKWIGEGESCIGYIMILSKQVMEGYVGGRYGLLLATFKF